MSSLVMFILCMMFYYGAKLKLLFLLSKLITYYLDIEVGIVIRRGCTARPNDMRGMYGW